jgi:hypothetical protein
MVGYLYYVVECTTLSWAFPVPASNHNPSERNLPSWARVRIDKAETGGRLIGEVSAFNDSGRVVRNEPVGRPEAYLEAKISGESRSNIRERVFGLFSAAVSGSSFRMLI